jgi:hypothetical protein
MPRILLIVASNEICRATADEASRRAGSISRGVSLIHLTGEQNKKQSKWQINHAPWAATKSSVNLIMTGAVFQAGKRISRAGEQTRAPA